MRINFGNRVELCKRLVYPKGSDVLLVTTKSGLYVVQCNSRDDAMDLYTYTYIYGYIDVSDLKYSKFKPDIDYILSQIQLYSYKLPTVKIGNWIMDFREKYTLKRCE